MERAFAETNQLKAKLKTSWRMAAYALAVNQVAQAMELRGR